MKIKRGKPVKIKKGMPCSTPTCPNRYGQLCLGNHSQRRECRGREIPITIKEEAAKGE